MTNFKKIKAMGVGRLAKFIAAIPDNDKFWNEICGEHCKYSDGDICFERNSPRDCKTAVKHFSSQRRRRNA